MTQSPAMTEAPVIRIREPLRAAWINMRVQLFEPFVFKKWLALGFCAFLSQLASGGGGSFNFNTGPHNNTGTGFPDPAQHPWIIALVVVVVLFVLALMVLCWWLGARGTFMFLDGVVHNRALVRHPWREFKREGNRYFLSFSVPRYPPHRAGGLDRAYHQRPVELVEIYGQHSSLLALDIETLKATQITEVGFAADSTHALHIPFCFKDGKEYKSWWKETKTEVEAWKFVRHVCASQVPKIGQNGAQYDCFMFAKCMGIVVNNYQHDTMQAAHAWMPEMGKSLYDLGSIFLDEASWKSIRKDANKGEKAFE